MNIKKNIAVSDSGFIFNPNNGDSFTLNPIGLKIFQLIKEGKSESEIKEVVLEEYNVDAITLEKDIYDFSKSLVRYKLAHE
jgi:hypothetical protein